MPAVAFYISGHGFGHASRQTEIIRALRRRRPDVQVAIRTPAPRWMFDRSLGERCDFEAIQTDTGMVQRDSLTIDVAASIVRARDFHRSLDARAEAEAARLTVEPVDLVVGDIPPLASAAAARAGVPAVVVGNFTWDWIYAGYEETTELAPALVDTIREAYASADQAWRLPLHGGFETFDGDRLVDIPLVARRSERSPADVRRQLGLPTDRILVLCAFGRYGVGPIDWVRLSELRDCHTVATTGGPAPMAEEAPSCAVTTLDEAWMAQQAIAYEDLVAAVDVVATKPGYGIVSECAANGTAMIYTERGRFPEYDVLVAGMEGLLRTAFIERDDLFAGRWQASIERALAQPLPGTPPLDGAEVAARMIDARLP
ncbi:MAG: hypothetical protein F4Y45_15660 [Acidobacteria bacterium]|nr:hypothetical protein [Acidobacteriota bacterium]MYD70658.1 hypothetical protein [Acidobacteriota bacterium]MYJ03280.1 hypothetical protein [Acidobacteriota bacterium]